MLNAKKRVNVLLWVVVGVVLLVGITFARVFVVSKSASITVCPVSLSTKIVMNSDLQDVVPNETVIDSASFTVPETSKEAFVRANVRYYVDRTMTNDDIAFLISINYDGIDTISGTNYKWIRGEDYFYYLVDNDNLPLKISGADTTEYKLCENVVYNGAKSIGDSSAPEGLMLKVEIQAINTKNMASYKFDDVALRFKEFFGNNDTLGYIVTFDTDGAGTRPAQVFLYNNSTVTCPETPSKVGYIFQGWYKDGEVYDFSAPVTSNFTLHAKFVEGKKATVITDRGTSSVEITMGSGENVPNGGLIPLGEEITIVVTPKNGYTVNWTVKNGESSTENVTKVTVEGDVEINVTSTLQGYTITYNLAGGTVSKTNPTSYTVESDDITLNNPTKAGYTFTGWTGSNGDTAQKTVTIASGSTGNKTYTANWTINGYKYTVTAKMTGTAQKVTVTANGTSKDITASNGTAVFDIPYNTSFTPSIKVTYTSGKYNLVWGTSVSATPITSGVSINRSSAITMGTNGLTDTVTLTQLYYVTATLSTNVGTNATYYIGETSTPTTSFTGSREYYFTTNTNVTLYAKAVFSSGKYNYTFNSASAASVASGTVVNSGAFAPTYTGTTKTLTVSQLYTLEAKASGYGTVTPTSATLVIRNGSANITATATSATGYTTNFASWSVTSGTCKISSTTTASTTVTGITADSVVTASFTRTANTYMVVYNGNGSTGGATANSTHTYGVAKNLTTNGYTREYTVTYNHNYTGSTNTTATAKYTFSKWNTVAGGTGKDYGNGVSVTNLSTSGTFNLYAQWTSASVTLETPTRTGYSFGGWYKEAGCTTSVGAGGASYTPTSAITLYAKWTVNGYTVTYNASTNGGTTSQEAKTVNYGTAIDLTPKATKTGYTFVGWNTNKDATTKLSNLTMGTSNVTLYAIYSKVVTYNFYQVDNTNDSKTVTIYNNNKGTITAPALDTVSGLTVVGWGTSATATASGLASGGKDTSVSENKTYYAVYKYTVTVTYNGNGSTSGSVTSSTGTAYRTANPSATSGYNVTNASITLSNNGFAKTGYTFSKWAEGSTSGTTYAEGTNRSLSANVTEYAIWTINTYTVTINVNEEGWGTVSKSSVTNVPYGAQLSASGSTLTVNGTKVTATPATKTAQYTYTFKDWSTNDGVTVIKDMTITANFTRTLNSYTVSITDSNTATTVKVNGNALSSDNKVCYGDVLTISVTATSGYIASWTVLVGSGTPTSNATSVTATDDVTIDVIGELPKATLPKTYLTTLGITDATTINTITFYDSVSEAESVIGSTIMGTQLNAGVTTDNGTVYGLAVANTTDTSKYDIHIASDGIIRFPADSSSFFYNYTNLTAINNLEIVDFSEVTNTESMIYYCSKLTSVNFGQNCGLNNIGQSTFYYCEGLTNMVMPDSVTTIGVQAFMGCKSLESITIPSSVNSIGSGAFGGCGLVSVEVESGNTTYDSRDNCNAIIKTSTNELVVGCKNTVIPSSVVSIGAEAFRGCSGLTSISIPSTVTEIGSWAFAYCSGLTSINIPSGVTAISEYTFYYCTGLVTVTIPEGVTSIGGYALFGCKNIKKLIIPSTVTTVGDNAMNTTAIKSYIVVKGTNVTLGDHSFGGKANMVYVFCENSTMARKAYDALQVHAGPMVLYKSSDTLTGTQVWKAYDDEMIGRIGETERLYLDGTATNYFRIVGTTDVYKKISY